MLYLLMLIPAYAALFGVWDEHHHAMLRLAEQRAAFAHLPPSLDFARYLFE